MAVERFASARILTQLQWLVEGERALGLGLGSRCSNALTREGVSKCMTDPIPWAMTLSWKTSLTYDTYEPFMRSGTIHFFLIRTPSYSILHKGLAISLFMLFVAPLDGSRGCWCLHP